MFDEQKLRWMNGRYLRELPVEELRARLEDLTGRSVPAAAVEISREKMQTLADFWPLAGFLVEPQAVDEKAWAKVMRDGAFERLRMARAALELLERQLLQVAAVHPAELLLVEHRRVLRDPLEREALDQLLSLIHI